MEIQGKKEVSCQPLSLLFCKTLLLLLKNYYKLEFLCFILFFFFLKFNWTQYYIFFSRFTQMKTFCLYSLLQNFSIWKYLNLICTLIIILYTKIMLLIGWEDHFGQPFYLKGKFSKYSLASLSQNLDKCLMSSYFALGTGIKSENFMNCNVYAL